MELLIVLAGIIFGAVGYYMYTKITKTSTQEKGKPGAGGTPHNTPHQL